jgi:hypothetical protein
LTNNGRRSKTQQTKDGATRTTFKIGPELVCSRRVKEKAYKDKTLHQELKMEQHELH